VKTPHHAVHHRVTTHAVGKAAKPAKPGGGGTSATGGKGTATGKHHAAAHHKHQPKKARKWTIDGDIALCSLRALVTALGAGLTDDELAAAYFTLTADPDAGVPIADAVSLLGGRLRMPVLGISYPEPHAVAVAPDGRWWSWGRLWAPWTDQIDEVWTPWR